MVSKNGDFLLPAPTVVRIPVISNASSRSKRRTKMTPASETWMIATKEWMTVDVLVMFVWFRGFSEKTWHRVTLGLLRLLKRSRPANRRHIAVVPHESR